MGDLVLLQSEVNPVMAKLIEGGLEVTASTITCCAPNPAVLHARRRARRSREDGRDHPQRTCGEQDAADGFASTGGPPAIDLDTAQIDQILGAKGANNGGVYAVNVPRRDPITEQGMSVGAPIMGGATAINFQPTGGGKAAITGDFALIGTEVQDVIRALRSNGIEVTAIHSHMLTEEPRIIFMHFWANDDAIKLAKGLRAALDKTASARS